MVPASIAPPVDTAFDALLVSTGVGTITLAQVTRVLLLSPSFGPLVLTVYRMVRNLLQWMLLLLLVNSAFALALHTYVVAVDVLDDCQDQSEIALAESLLAASWYLFKQAINYGPRTNTYCFDASPFLSQVMFVYEMLSAIMLIKMLTAFMTHAFHDVWDHSTDNHQLNAAQFPLTYDAKAAAPPPVSILVLLRKAAAAVVRAVLRCYYRIRSYNGLSDHEEDTDLKPQDDENWAEVWESEDAALLKKIEDTIADERPEDKKWQSKVDEELKEKFANMEARFTKIDTMLAQKTEMSAGTAATPHAVNPLSA